MLRSRSTVLLLVCVLAACFAEVFAKDVSASSLAPDKQLMGDSGKVVLGIPASDNTPNNATIAVKPDKEIKFDVIRPTCVKDDKNKNKFILSVDGCGIEFAWDTNLFFVNDTFAVWNETVRITMRDSDVSFTGTNGKPVAWNGGVTPQTNKVNFGEVDKEDNYNVSVSLSQSKVGCQNKVQFENEHYIEPTIIPPIPSEDSSITSENPMISAISNSFPTASHATATQQGGLGAWWVLIIAGPILLVVIVVGVVLCVIYLRRRARKAPAAPQGGNTDLQSVAVVVDGKKVEPIAVVADKNKAEPIATETGPNLTTGLGETGATKIVFEKTQHSEIRPPVKHVPNAKELRIQAGLFAKKTDYPTMDDVVSDWGDDSCDPTPPDVSRESKLKGGKKKLGAQSAPGSALKSQESVPKKKKSVSKGKESISKGKESLDKSVK